MDVAALVLGIIGTVLALGSAVWNVAQYLLSGARPRLTPVIGPHFGGGALPMDAITDVSATMHALEKQLGADAADRIVGVTVVNIGRADLVVTRWSFRVLPAGMVFHPPHVPGSPELPSTIPSGGEQTFFTTATQLHGIAAASLFRIGKRRQRLVATITSAGRRRNSKPIYAPMLTEPETTAEPPESA